MKLQQLVTMLDETGLSPEDLSPRLGVSPMTYRRWLKAPASKGVPAKYESQVREGVYRLISEGLLSSESKEVAAFLSQGNTSFFEAVIRNLNMKVPEEFAVLGSCHEDQVAVGLSRIGSNTTKQKEVDNSVKRIRSFETFGAEWKKRVTTMLSVIQSRRLTLVDKLVAYGALFYLITPFDLIPDTIPVFGYIDDFAILSFALAYYVKRFPELVESG